MQKDYFVSRDGETFAGLHLLYDMWEAEHLDDKAYVEAALCAAAAAAKATVLHIHLHEFSETGGLSGVAVLAESHISVHTWPERGFAAFDIFMCGDCDSYDAVPTLRAAFAPGREQLDEVRRGRNRSAAERAA